MTLAQLTYFIEIAKTKNFTEAASNLYISQSNISYAIHALEDELDALLFVRRPNKKIELTMYGEALYPYIAEGIRLIEEGKNRVSSMKSPLHGSVRLAFFHSIVFSAVPALMSYFREDNPGNEIEFQTMVFHNWIDFRQLLLDGKCDLILSAGNLGNGCESVRIAEHRIFLAVFTDPTYTYTVPPFQTACGILDIMSHAYEGYFSASAGIMQDGISETIQRTCVERGRKVMQVPRDYDSRAELLWAAQLSIAHVADQGRNFVGNIHAVERVIGNYFGFPHGAGIAVVSLAWFKYALGDRTAHRFARWAKNVWDADPAMSDMAAAEEGIRRYEAFIEELGVPSRLSQSKLAVSEELVARCADEIWERVDASTWFKPLSDKQELIDFLMLAW